MLLGKEQFMHASRLSQTRKFSQHHQSTLDIYFRLPNKKFGCQFDVIENFYNLRDNVMRIIDFPFSPSSLLFSPHRTAPNYQNETNKVCLLR